MSSNNSDNGSKKQEHMDFLFMGEHLQVTIKNLPEEVTLNGEPMNIGDKLAEVFATIDSGEIIFSDEQPDTPKGTVKIALILYACLTRGMHEFTKDSPFNINRNRHESQN